MPLFEVEHNGKRYQIEAPDADAVAKALGSLGAAPKPPEAPVKEGDWQDVAGRLKAAETRLLDQGPPMETGVQDARLAEARRQGDIYGQTRPAAETAFRRATNTAGAGLPALLEAATSGFGTGLSTAETHEFIKSADAGRSAANPVSDFAGLGLGIVGQAATLPVAAAPTMMGRIGANAALGGTLGAAEGAFTSRGDAEEAAKGAAFGATGGAAGSAIVERLAPYISKAGDFLATRAAKFSGTPDEQAAARIVDVAQKAGLDNAAVTQKVADLGPEAMLVDTLGPAGGRLGRVAANSSTEAQRMLEEASSGRMARVPERLMSAAERAANTTERKTVEQLQAETFDQLRPAISSAYEKARTAGYDLPDAPFRDLRQSPMVESAIRRAEGDTVNRVVAFGEGQNSQLAVYDAAKRNLDAIAQKALRDGDKGLAQTAGELAKKLRETVDEITPEYSPARAARRAGYEAEEAINLGAEAASAKPGMDVPARIAGNPYDDLIAKGYASALAERINNMRGTPGLVDSVFGSPGSQNAMAAALRARAADMNKAVDAEKVFGRTHRDLTGNSSTARQLADLGIIPAAAGVGYLGGYDPLQSGGLAALLVAGRRGVNKVVDARRAVSEEKVAARIAEILTKQALPDAPQRMLTGWEKRIAEALIASGRLSVVPGAVAARPREEAR